MTRALRPPIGSSLVLAVALAALPTSALAARQELVVRGPEPSVVELGRRATITVELQGFRGAAELLPWSPPSARVEVDGPRESTFQTLVDGKIAGHELLTWRVAVEPTAVGVLELPSIAVRAGGLVREARPARVECVARLDGARRAFIELSTPRERSFVGQEIELSLRIGVERALLENDLVALFAQPLDVPVQVDAPWWDDLAGAALVDDRAPPEPSVRIALGDAVIRVRQVDDVERDGRVFAVLEASRTFVPTRSGELRIPSPVLRFAWTTLFVEDLFGNEVPIDPRHELVRGEPSTLAIEPLPEPGRPPQFSGAVGDFRVAATIDRDEVGVGESVKLSLRIEGDGNLERFEAPRLDRLADFHLRGQVERSAGGARTITYDLAPRDARVSSIPPIELPFFDPESATYRSAQSEPLRLRVRALERPVEPLKSGRPSTAIVATLVGLAVLLSIGAVAWIRSARARRERRDLDRRAARVAAAQASFREALERGFEHAEASFARVVAAKLGCSIAGVHTPDLGRRLTAAGASDELASRVARTVERLVAARYGGGDDRPSDQALIALVGELESSLADRAVSA